MPSSPLANALLLQAHDNVSDEEAKVRADYDLRWEVEMGIRIDEQSRIHITCWLMTSGS